MSFKSPSPKPQLNRTGSVFALPLAILLPLIVLPLNLLHLIAVGPPSRRKRAEAEARGWQQQAQEVEQASERDENSLRRRAELEAEHWRKKAEKEERLRKQYEEQESLMGHSCGRVRGLVSPRIKRKEDIDSQQKSKVKRKSINIDSRQKSMVGNTGLRAPLPASKKFLFYPYLL